jgi:tetratricopeptide (TPR) repeat protein
LRRILCIALIVFAGVSCSRDPEVVKKKYLQNGNRYFEKGKYKEAYIMYRNALKKDARYSEAYYRVGLTELRLGEPLAALRDMRRAADTDPNFTNPDSRVQAGNLVITAYVMNESHPPVLKEELRGLSSELLKHNPKSVAGLRLRGYLKLFGDKDPHGAVDDFRLADQISPSEPETVLPLVQSLQSIGQSAEAEKLGKDLIEKHKDFLAMYDVLYMSYLRAQRTEDAEAILKLKAANNPKDPAHLLQLAQHYYRFNRRADMQQTLDRVLSNRKAYPMGPLLVAKFYAAIRDFDAALKLLDEGARADTAHKPDYRKETAEVLVAENRKDEAVRLLEQILKDNPKDERAQAMRSSLMIETGDPKQLQQAVSELQAAVARDSNNPVLRFNLGRALVAKNLFEQARVQFQEALKIRREYVPARLALAQLFILNHEYGSAVQTAKEVLDYDPRNLAARLVRTSGLRAMGNPALARTELEETIAQYPSSAEAQLQLGTLDLGEKRFQNAEQAFRKVYQDHPADLRALMGIVESYTLQKQYDKAIQLLQGELAKNPGRLELKNALGGVALMAGKWDLAVEQFEAILAARPDAGELYVPLGQALEAKGDDDGAARTFEKAKQMRPNDPAPCFQLAQLMEKVGKPAQARPLYEQVLKLQPDNAIALNNLAYLLAETGSPADLDQALQLAQTARQKLPDSPSVADTLGWVYIKKKLNGNAVSLFRDLVAKEPAASPSRAFATFYYHYGIALAQSGDKPLARKELKTALERKPPPDQAAKIKELLEKIG